MKKTPLMPVLIAPSDGAQVPEERQLADATTLIFEGFLWALPNTIV